jgi:predicted MPP superfamily phosphohydrolase
MRIGWLTDVHLNFLTPGQLESFLDSLARARADAWLVGGDIGEADGVTSYLSRIQASVGVPVYFVLGNHDYYGGSFASVGRAVRALSTANSQLAWLTRGGVVGLTERVGLVGHDTWGDARLGNVSDTKVQLNDFYYIEDLAGLAHDRRVRALNRLGDRAARALNKALDAALQKFARVICLVHVPPFREAAWHEGEPSGGDYLPYFSCKAVGDVLVSAATRFSDRSILVLCGHTHGSGVFRPLPNLEVVTGGAEYGRAEIQRIFEER